MSAPSAESGAPFDWSRINHGICPKCGEDKFIGHGPLCVDCFTGTPISPTATEGKS